MKQIQFMYNQVVAFVTVVMLAVVTVDVSVGAIDVVTSCGVELDQ